jgi:Ni,Fe-hydrogenase III large subunit/Ni,Fe-hydrogenase III component G
MTAVSVPAKVTDILELLGRDHVRLVSIFGTLDPDGRRRAHYIVDVGEQEYRILDRAVDGPVPSATAVTPAAAWYERELADQFGVEFTGHPDPRPLLFHENWPDGVHPMIQACENVPVVKREYRFLKVQGDGVCEVPVGPVHAGIIEPGHFRFSVVGDTILHLELRHFYTHKGTEKLFVGTPVQSGSLLAESVSGDNCFAHAVAYCQAIEGALGVEVPRRAQALRLVGLELERMVAHVADVGALCGDVGFTVPAPYTARLKESLLRASTDFASTRFWRGIATPGGIRMADGDPRALAAAIRDAAADFAALAYMILDTPSVQDRFETTGILKREIARDLAVVGPAARASSIRMDVRRDHPYGFYRDFPIEVPHFHYGDVLARSRVRIDEVAVSARILADVLDALPTGPLAAAVPAARSGEGWSAVESPRGELLYWVRVDAGRVARCHIKSPSFQNWPALPLTMPGNIIADFPLINKSFNLSYSGCDR